MAQTKLEKEIQYVLPGYEAEVSAAEEAVRRWFLAPFFTNLDRDVCAVTDRLPSRITAILVARQSRSAIRDPREILWRELVDIPELNLRELRRAIQIDELNYLKMAKAGEMTTRIVDGFGDDSVREDASGYVMVQDASILATTFGFTHPLLTRIEASTRYINWGQKEEDRYRYKDLDFGEDSQASEVYGLLMEKLFSTYEQLWQPVRDYVVATNPIWEGITRGAYENAIRGKVCDNLKGLLPLSALTNFGLHGDFRALGELIMNLRAEENGEMRALGDAMAMELQKINPEFLAVVNNEHGEAWTEYKQKREKYLAQNQRVVAMPKEGNKKPGVELAVSTRYFLYTVAKAFLNGQNPNADKGELNRRAMAMVKNGEMEKVLRDLGRMRTNRRHELPDFLRKVVLNLRFRQISFGSLKDLFRHRRILWRTKPDFSGQNGCHIPKDILAMGGGVLEKYRAAQRTAAETVAWMKGCVGEDVSRYCLTQGMLTTFDIDCDLVEAYWISELRSIASGFEEYRWFAQEVWQALIKKMPALRTLGSFTDMNEYSLGRIKEAVRTDLRGRD